MKKGPTGQVALSASDIVNFLRCEHLTQLDLRHLDDPQPRAVGDDYALLLQRKGTKWEHEYLTRLRADHPDLIEIPSDISREDAATLTREAMRAGVSIIFQATLLAQGYMGRADFLRRVPGASIFGNYHYEVLDTKLAKHPKPGHILQLCFYSWLVEDLQGAAPKYMFVVLGDGQRRAFRYADYSRYFHRLRKRVRAAVDFGNRGTYPHPCEHCSQCHWNAQCESQRVTDDHLWQVANITRQQIVRLTNGGVATLTQLAQADPYRRIPRLNQETYRRLQAQANMQHRGRGQSMPVFELKALMAGRGFARLPQPSAGDVYFDMEGDPLYEDGLEYLFGVTYRDQGQLQFRAFWAHTRAEEKVAFEALMDWLSARIRRWPDMHVYHYASYERSALTRLMSLHGTREDEVDQLLRDHRLVDLYRVVVESLIASTPSYSIKDIERFYRGQRTAYVANATASVIWYERWRETGDAQLLTDIENYNKDDCDSTAQLHDWLLTLRPESLSWPSGLASQASLAQEAAEDTADPIQVDREARRNALTALLPADPLTWSRSDHAHYLVLCLLDFHRRCDKPVWWKLFSCADMPIEALIDDAECIGGMQRVRIEPPQGRGRIPIWVYSYPDQEFKTHAGQTCTRTDTLASILVLDIDEGSRQISMRPSRKALPDPDLLSLGPPMPINTDVLQEAIARFADSVLQDTQAYPALKALLEKQPPKVAGCAPGAPLVTTYPPTVSDASGVVSALQESYLLIQGPPGAGKTSTGSGVIADLLESGHSVGISSNSHKAIDNLLEAVAREVQSRGLSVSMAKKINRGAEFPLASLGITPVEENDLALHGGFQLLAGTAWLFAREDADQLLDYLFIDEAGQVSLGHLVAMGTAARNLVLLGDQMQLPQPIQGVHPGRSGDSVMDYLLDGVATVDPARGIFLPSSWRMHPDICRFISDAVYDGQLVSAPGREQQTLLTTDAAHPALRPTGIRFWPVYHDGCSQRSEEEAQEVLRISLSLLQQRWRNHDGQERPITVDDFLVVSPYNMQVNLLRQVLPDGVRVGTIDKFQGQEAPVVLVSMATSSGDYLPRDIEFLYSKNRLNVALSRAKCLAVLVASPLLLDIPCRTAEQIALVNTLCWVEEYSSECV